MAQFEVYRLGSALVVDCQSDLLSQIDSRFVAPLVPRSDAPPAVSGLNPVLKIRGEDYVMLTQSAGAVRRRELGEVIASLAERSFEITNAIDVLVSGV